MTVDESDVVVALYHAVGETGKADLNRIADDLRTVREFVAPLVRAMVTRDEPLLQELKTPNGAFLYSLTGAGVAFVFNG